MPIGIKLAKKGLGLLGKKLRKQAWVKSELKSGTSPVKIKQMSKPSYLGKELRKEPWVKATLKRGWHPGVIKDRAKEFAEIKADRILKKKNIERIRQLDPKVYGKDIATFGSGIKKKQIKKIFPKGKK